MKNRTPYFVLLLFTIFSACEFDAVLKPKDYPQIETNAPLSDTSGVLFKATIIHSGSKPILKYGFAWGRNNNPTIGGNTVLLDEAIPEDSFSIKVIDGLTTDAFWVRAYVATEDYEVYGMAVPFQSTFYSKPVISDFNPKGGYTGDSFVIEGRNLSFSGKTTSVKIGTYNLHIDTCLSNRLVVKIPQIYGKSKSPITISIESQIVESKDSFVLSYPWTQKKNYPEGFYNTPVTFSSANNGYVICRTNNFMRIYYPIADAWYFLLLPMSSGGQLDFSVNDTINPYLSAIETKLLAFSAGSKAYIFLSGVFWEYNTLTNSWTQKSAFPGVLEGENKCVFGMFTNGKLYLGNCGTNKTFWEYNPDQNSWSRKADFIGSDISENILGNFSFSVANKSFVGVTSSAGICKIFSYDPVGDCWTQKGNLPYAPYLGEACFVIDDHAYVGFGNSLNSDFWHLFKYEAATDSWSNCFTHPNIGNSIVNASFVVNEKAYLLFPFFSVIDKCEVWEYEPLNNR